MMCLLIRARGDFPHLSDELPRVRAARFCFHTFTNLGVGGTGHIEIR